MWDEDFAEWLLGVGLSGRTATIYGRHVERAERWLGERGVSLELALPSEIGAYAETLPRSSSTRRQLRSALRLWWAWAKRVNPPVASVRVPPKPRPVCRALEADDARRLVKAGLGWWPEGTAVLFGMYLALRREEIATARWDGFDPECSWYTVTGKRDLVACLPVHPVLASEVRGKRRRGSYVFPGRGARPHVSPATVWLWVRRVAQEADVGLVRPHELRHTALATANDRTGDLRATQEFARHARPETTAIYTRATAARLQGVVASLDYLT